jgi:hypothetical protein
VRRRHDRDRLHREVDPELLARLVDVREVVEQERLRQVRHVEVGAVVAAALHLRVDAAGHDVARGQLLARVVAGHEGLALAVPQDAALAAQRLGDEEALRRRVIEAGGVELEELEVRHRRAGAPGHGQPVAGRHVRVRGVEVRLARAAGGEHGDARGEGGDLPRRAVEHVGAERPVGPGDAGLRRGEQVDADLLLHDADAALVARFEQGALHLAAGGVLGVGDAPPRVAPLAGQVQVALLAVEADAELEQPADPVRPLADGDVDGVPVAQAGAGHQRVLDVALGLVVGAQHRRDAALGVLGVPLAASALGQDHHAAERARLQGEGESGDTSAEHQEVGIRSCAKCAHGGFSCVPPGE